ncbi:uncharacterized protein LOC130369495 [Hyla sarda]|uniref:uncharacterized protein LOC130369495 n=1 Tax=Hyla sarda TaxID=327740 RepID=UPI0024C408AC|nr:uncharacterized protein LOC130369495 [Hyla sarda]XP_056430809.1 uncharacterized protein LOC130369495 [Hyla sarda]
MLCSSGSGTWLLPPPSLLLLIQTSSKSSESGSGGKARPSSPGKTDWLKLTQRSHFVVPDSPRGQNTCLVELQYTAQAWPPPLPPFARPSPRQYFASSGAKWTELNKDPIKGGKGVPEIPTLLRPSFACFSTQRTLVEKKGSAGRSMSCLFLLPHWKRIGWDKWDSSIPYNWHTSWFYGDVVRFIGEHQLEGLKPDLWKPKTFYKLIRAKDLLELVPGLPKATAETVWDNVASARLTDGHNDLLWMAIQGGLSLRSFMHVHGLCKTRYCPRCLYVEETSMHIFWQCPFVQGLLNALELELRDSVPKNNLLYHSVLYGLFPWVHDGEAIQEA